MGTEDFLFEHSEVLEQPQFLKSIEALSMKKTVKGIALLAHYVYH